MAELSRYANDWNAYSKVWEATFGKTFEHIGDEWNAGERKTDEFIFDQFVLPYIDREKTVLEVGPGGGKWTVQIAPLVKKLVVLDVSQEMLDRTQKRCDAAGLTNVEFVLGNSRDFQPIPDASIDFFFSYDVFVHIVLEDTFAYVHEMARVLAPGCPGVCHHAINTVPGAYFRLEQEVDYYRTGNNTIGQYYYHSPEGLRRMYEHCGLPLIRTDQWWCMQVLAFRKAEANIIPELELLLWRLVTAKDGDESVNSILDDIQKLPAKLEEYITRWIEETRITPDHATRLKNAAIIRRGWRGIL